MATTEAPRKMARPRNDLDQFSPDLTIRFALKLRAIMAEKGWSSDDVAQRIQAAGVDITHRGVDCWLRGEGLPKAKDLEAVGEALGYADYRMILPDPKKPLAVKKRRSK